MKHLQYWSEDDEQIYTEIATARPRFRRSSTIRPSRTSSRSRTLGELLHSLPPELLAEIFWWCTPSIHSQDTSPPHSPLVLTHVCQHWRIIATKTPSLWTYTKLSVYDQLLAPALELMKLWLKRSGMMPVFIDLDFEDSVSYYRTVLKLFEEVISVAKQYRPAWYIADSFLATHLEVVSGKMSPKREEWYFWAARPSNSQPSPPSTHSRGRSISSLSQNPHPPTITIRALRFAFGPFVLQPYLPWTSSLTFLILRDTHAFTSFTNNDAALVLSSFPMLVHCAMHITLADIDDLMDAEQDPVAMMGAQEDMMTVTAGHVRLRHLKSFSISWSAFADVGPLLDSLTLPSITELELSGALPYVGNNERWPHLSTLLHRSNAPLAFLTLEHTDCIYLALIECLDACTVLKGLWLDDCIVDDDVIRGLYRPPHALLSSDGSEYIVGPGKGVLTTLNTLVLQSCYLISLDILIGVLKARDQYFNPSTPTPASVHALSQSHVQTSSQQGTGNGDENRLMTYVVDCGELTPMQSRMLERLGMRDLIVGPRMGIQNGGIVVEVDVEGDDDEAVV